MNQIMRNGTVTVHVVLVIDDGTYHIGDQTIAEITESYNNGTWDDPNPPSFLTELIGRNLREIVPFN